MDLLRFMLSLFQGYRRGRGRGWGIRDRRLVGMVVNVIRRGCYTRRGIGLEGVGKGKGWHW